MNRQLAGWISHHWIKWVVALVMIVLVGVLGSFASKLTGEQENDIGSWLPGDAESTKVIEQSAAFADPEALPAILLFVFEYSRSLFP